MTTVFVAPEDWESERLELEGAVFHHLFRVARLAAGDTLRVADGAGRARTGRIESVGRASASIVLGEPAATNEPAVEITLLVVGPKKPRAEWLVEKTTELGVHAVRFLRSERGPRSYGDGAFKRLRRVARSAAEQCGRSRLPEVTGMHHWDEIAALVHDSENRLVLDRSGASLSSRLSSSRLAVLVGPEGGFSPAELDALAAQGFSTAAIGDTTLRVETACVVAVAGCVLAH
ncbi:MAG: RsmE family RNA methyltransferase [Thermoanaerobaculia bacterium]